MSTPEESKDSKAVNKTEGGGTDTENVHSANSWETVDLGDDERKKKFLRLMGASKKEHHGKFVIGDHEPIHGREKTDTDHVNEELERQFRISQEHKITRFSHTGLGFDDAGRTSSSITKPVSDTADSNTTEEKVKDPSDDSKQSSSEKKRESKDSPEESLPPPKKTKMMMNFVKASD